MQQGWHEVIGNVRLETYFKALLARVEQERLLGKTIYPAKEDVFNALRFTDFSQVKVVILGQDPYHGHNQAHGLAFSVQPGIKTPPSLVNIYKELAEDIAGFTIPNHGYLQSWAEQGVLLLNSVLTVEAGKAHSHAQWGWEKFTDRIIQELNEKAENIVFLLWGAPAQKKGAYIDRERHCVLTAPHPSPLSAYRGFFGCRHFSQANNYLLEHEKGAIEWQLPNSL